MIGVPLMREGEPIGVIGLARNRVEPFNDREIELVTTFANQAVIAIENVRLFEAEQQRTRELTESLEQQTATSEVLQVISSSPGDLQPVFDAMLENAVQICDASLAISTAGKATLCTTWRRTTRRPRSLAQRRSEPFRPAPINSVGRMMASKAVVHVPDVAASEAYAKREPAPSPASKLAACGRFLAVPMLKDNELIGAFALCSPGSSSVYRETDRSGDEFRRPGRHRHREHAAADRTAPAHRRLTESLEQQTATSEVLRRHLEFARRSGAGVSKACWRMHAASAGPNFGNMFLYVRTTALSLRRACTMPRLPSSSSTERGH